MKEIDEQRLKRVADTDPHVDVEDFNNFFKHTYSLDVNKSDEVSSPTSYDFEGIRGATVRPGFDSKLKSEGLSNSPSTKGDYQVYRADPIDIKTYQKMSVDPHIAFGTFLLKGWIGGLEYTIECPDKKIREITDYIFSKVWKNLVRNMLDAVKLGFSFGEKIWQRESATITADGDDGKEEIVYKGKIASLDRIKFLNPNHYFKFFKNKSDQISRVEQRQGVKKISVDRDKLVWFTLDQEYSSVFGRSRYKNIYSEWYFSKINIQYLLNDLQKRGSPHLEIRYPRGQSQVDGKQMRHAEVARMIAEKLMSDGIVALPSETHDSGEPKWSIKFADTKESSGENPFIKYLKYSDKRKMKGLGIPPSVADGDSNFSQADAQADMLVVIIEDIVSQLEVTIQKDVVDQIVEYNFGPSKKSLVKLKIDRSALGRRRLVKEVLKNMIRTGSSMQDYTLKRWPDPTSMLKELGISSGAFSEVFSEVQGSNRKDGETLMDEMEDDEGSNDTEGRRNPDDMDRDRERPSKRNDATDTV